MKSLKEKEQVFGEMTTEQREIEQLLYLSALLSQSKENNHWISKIHKVLFLNTVLVALLLLLSLLIVIVI